MNMDTILNLLAGSSAITLMMQTKWYEAVGLNYKPFNCTMCSGFWLSLMPWFMYLGFKGILMASLTGIIAEFIDRKIGQY